MAELIVENYEIEELAKITNLKKVDINHIQRLATEQANASIQQQANAKIKEANPQTPEEVARIQVEAQKFMQNSQAIAQKFVQDALKQPLNDLKGYAATPEQLAEIDATMKDDKLRSFAVDIETDSTVRIDQNQEKADRIEYVQAITNYSTGMFPLVQAGIITPTTFNEMLLFVSKPFKIGRNLEEHLIAEEETNPEPEQPSMEEQLAQAENQRKDQEVSIKQQLADIQQQLANVKKAEVKVGIEQFNENMESEDVNKEADRRVKTSDQLIQDATQRATSAVRESDLLGGQ